MPTVYLIEDTSDGTYYTGRGWSVEYLEAMQFPTAQEAARTIRRIGRNVPGGLRIKHLNR